MPHDQAAFPPLVHRLQAVLDRVDARDERRVLAPVEALPGGRVRRGERTLLDLSSNDYLGLAQHPVLIDRACTWARRHGAGAGASRLVTGTTDALLALEAKLARWKGTEAALIFASGWQANAAVLAALLAAAPDTIVFADRLIHASLHAGLAGTRQQRFRHNDLDHLEALLAAADPDAPKLIVTESVFSMDGDRVDLVRLAALARAHQAFLFLDEAHATGVLGPDGAGLGAERPGSVDLAIGTFSKAMGGFGAYVAGSRLLCDYLVNRCSGFVFTTAPPPAMLGAIDAALDLVPVLGSDRARLAEGAERVRSAAGAAGYDVGASTTQIVPLIVGGTREARALASSLLENGVLAAAIRPPTVPNGSSRVRLALKASHSDADLDRVISLLASARR